MSAATAMMIRPLPTIDGSCPYLTACRTITAYAVMVRQAVRYGQDPSIVGNGLIIIAVAALIGGRLYHVIDQGAPSKDDLLKIGLPPYSGIGGYAGPGTGTN